MTWNFLFFFNSILLGAGLAMDAFSVSVANALNEPCMNIRRKSFIAGIYAFFQFAMPMIGWFCVSKIIFYFQKFQPFIPWIALILLLYIGGNMILESVKEMKKDADSDDKALDKVKKLTIGTLIIQGIATSIDALSVGFTIADYNTLMAFIASVIIAIVTFAICMCGLQLGCKVGEKISDKAGIFGGVILIAIGIEIFVKCVFF